MQTSLKQKIIHLAVNADEIEVFSWQILTCLALTTAAEKRRKTKILFMAGCGAAGEQMIQIRQD